MSRRIAILGAGIMGSCLALALSRHGASVTLHDAEARPMERASRWNEGKIHLGYLYGADQTLATARHVVTGGINFAPVLSRLLGTDIRPLATRCDDHYLIHRRSVAPATTVEAVFAAIDRLVREHPDAPGYLGDLSAAESRPLGSSRLAELCDTSEITAGFAVPERSVDTQAIADLTVRALSATPGLAMRLGARVTAVAPVDMPSGPWRVMTEDMQAETYDLVINALWQGRMAVDATAGLPAAPGAWSNRYRLALFVTTAVDIDVACRIVAVGPFGDVKSYGPRRFYLSWYPSGLMLDSADVLPRDPRPFAPDKVASVVEGVRAQLGALLPDVAGILDAAHCVTCEGGFVFARGTGSIGDPSSTLHRRDRFGVVRHGSYLSVDTGKYSTAPWMADRLAAEIAGVS